MKELFFDEGLNAVIGVDRAAAQSTFETIVKKHSDACVMIIGPSCKMKEEVVHAFLDSHHCFNGGDPKWIISSPIDLIHEVLVKNKTGTTVLDIREEDVKSEEMRKTLLDKLTQAGFKEIIGIYIDNSSYIEYSMQLLLASGIIDLKVDSTSESGKKHATIAKTSEEYPERLLQVLARMLESSGLVTAQSRDVCQYLTIAPPSCAEFSGGMIRVRPKWAVN